MLATCLIATMFAAPLGAQGVDFRGAPSGAPAAGIQGIDFRTPPAGAPPIGVARPVGGRPRPVPPRPPVPVPILIPPAPYPVPAPQARPAYRPVDQKHVMVGAAIGAGFGAVAGLASQPTPDFTRSGQVLLSSMLFGLIGAGIGSCIR
jgi:hypothetical protein